MDTTITILDRSNTPRGPFTRTEVAERLHAGEFTIESLAFTEGLAAWTPLREVLARVDAATVIPPAPVAPALPSTAAFPLAPLPVGAPAAPYSYAATMAPPTHLVYAGFWIRVAAYLIDFLIFLPLIGVETGASLAMQHASGTVTRELWGAVYGLAVIASLFIPWLYFALLESGLGQATLGKRALGLYVTDLQGKRLSFGRATGRFFAKIISGMPCEIGFMIAGFTERKQALHDLIASTLVVRR